MFIFLCEKIVFVLITYTSIRSVTVDRLSGGVIAVMFCGVNLTIVCLKVCVLFGVFFLNTKDGGHLSAEPLAYTCIVSHTVYTQLNGTYS